MRNLVLLASMAALFSGCATIKKQQNIGKIMETHVFDATPDELYKAAEAEFEKMYVPLKPAGKLKGATQWLTKHSELGSKKYKEQDRFVVEILPQGEKKSRITVTRELKSDFTGNWTDKPSSRMYIYEYNIQRRLNPTIAQQIDAKAAKM